MRRASVVKSVKEFKAFTPPKRTHGAALLAGQPLSPLDSSEDEEPKALNAVRALYPSPVCASSEI